jgi:transcriptional regulator with XRE-family HTH domain
MAVESIREILQRTLTERQGRHAAYSLRALARDLGVSHTYLSLVLSGKRRVPPARMLALCQCLGLDRVTTSRLVAEAVSLPKRPSRELSPRFVRMEIDRYKILSEWYHLAILDLTLVRGFQSDSRWVAGRLGITPRVAQAAVNRLLRLGLLRVECGRWMKTHVTIAFPRHAPSRPVRHFHQQMIAKSLEALQSNRPGDFEARDITGTTIPVDPSRLPAARHRIERFRRRLLAFLSQGECTRLYQLNVQLFPLTYEESTKRRRSNAPRSATH